MRAADSDREAVAERLRSALNDGRLDLHEYDERLQQAYAAKTYADLRALLTDLPAEAPGQLVPVAPPMPPELVPGPDGRYPRATQRWLADQWGSYLRVVATTVGIWGAICLMSGGLTYFWPGWVAGPWGAVLLAQTVGGLFGGEPQRWAAKRARKKRAELERAAQGEEPDENAAAQER
ncbi:MAG TPA: DUF1707 domain-containing protein [Micromonosporaceae bacterium]|nr:DUF1707 domain-containing protein [Micromonosporaceae bacterium]